MPIFGICGGHQALNVYFGGTLKKLDDSEGHMETPAHHTISVEKDSFVWDVYRSESANVNCYHFQEIGILAPNLRAVAKTSDGVIEAIESREDKVFATQWHPERSFHDDTENPLDVKFFENFIKLCCEE